MATKKFYAVKKGKVTGIFDSWDACKASVDGFPGASYKGFATQQEAQAYLDGGAVGQSGEGSDVGGYDEIPPAGTLLVYVDGSHRESLGKYSFGCVFLVPDGRIYVEFGNGDNEQSLQHRNVSGEMLGAMYAVKTAMLNGYTHVELRYDYEGIEKWVTGEWRAKEELTLKYKNAMRDWGKSIGITFTKVAAHTNVRFNEAADKLAKKGLVEGKGIPKIRRLEELRTWAEVFPDEEL